MWHFLIHFFCFLIILVFAIDGLTFCFVRRVYQLVYKVNYRIGGFVVFLDLDGLKEINDKLGHRQGDFVLRRIGITLVLASRGRSFRYGGDEFVILTFSRKRFKAEKIMEKIKKQIGTTISFSYGIGKTEQEADSKMYQMKKNKNGTNF